jgi:hypothetical protein
MEKKYINGIILIIVFVAIILVGVFVIIKNNFFNTQITQRVELKTGEKFDRTGFLIIDNNGKFSLTYSNDNLGTKTKLVIDETVFCKQRGNPISCKQLQSGQKVEIVGLVYDKDTITVKEVNLFGEITVPAVK